MPPRIVAIVHLVHDVPYIIDAKNNSKQVNRPMLVKVVTAFENCATSDQMSVCQHLRTCEETRRSFVYVRWFIR